MKLVAIKKDDFPVWESMRKAIYQVMDDTFNTLEMETVYKSDDWFCYFIQTGDSAPIGLVELSARNIVDGCLSSPVAYLEGLYLTPDYRGMGIGSEVIQTILSWCQQKGFTELATDTESGNIRAQKFYKTLGFEEMEHCIQYRIDVGQSQ